jgi:hypothetical protein
MPFIYVEEDNLRNGWNVGLQNVDKQNVARDISAVFSCMYESYVKLLDWCQRFDTYFWRIFGERQIGSFLETQCYDQFLP